MAIGKLNANSDSRASAHERRKVPRVAVRARAIVTSSQGKSSKAAIGDLSLHGCSLIGVAGWLTTGNFVSVALESGDAVQAVVRWRRDENAGVEFLRPLPAASAEWHDLLEASWG